MNDNIWNILFIAEEENIVALSWLAMSEPLSNKFSAHSDQWKERWKEVPAQRKTNDRQWQMINIIPR